MFQPLRKKFVPVAPIFRMHSVVKTEVKTCKQKYTTVIDSCPFFKISLNVRPNLVADVEDVFDVGIHSVIFGGQKRRVQHDADGEDEIYPGAGDDSLKQ
jgi:hypothetical protein